MQKIINIIAIVYFVSLVTIATILFWSHKIRLELIGVVDYDFNKEGGVPEYMWYCVNSASAKKEEEKFRAITLPNVDFSQNYIYLTGERKLKRMSYNYFDLLTSQYNMNEGIYVGKGILSKEIYPDKIFVYKTDKIFLDTMDSWIIKR